MKVAWGERPLGEVCTLVGGGTPPKENPEFYSGNIPWATVRDMRTDIIVDTERSITSAGVRSCATNIIGAGNVVVATRVGLGKVCIVASDTAINQDLRGVVPNDPRELVPRFIFWWLKSISSQIVAEGTGATVQGVKLPFLRALRVPLPVPSEQRRIVGILDEAFEGLATARANAEKNLENAREVFDSQREAALAPRTGWNLSPLGDLCEIKHGFAFKGEFFRDSGEFVLLTPGNFFERGGYRDRGDKQKFYVGEIPQGYVLKRGDMLVAMTEQAAGLLGSPLLVPESNKFLHNQRLGLVVPRQGQPWTAEFFFHVFNLARVRREIHEGGTGAKVRHTSPGRIQAVQVAYPDDVESQRVVAEKLAEVGDGAESLESIYQQKLAALDELKKSLLHRAFSGQL